MLTDFRIRQAKPAARAYKLFDGGGLYLLVTPVGSKLWRYKYRIHGQENVFSIGAYPAFSLVDARREHVAARDRVNAGEHPVQLRRRRKEASKQAQENTFEAIGEEWYKAAVDAEQWTAYYAAQVRRGLDQDLYPRLGQRPIADITAPEMLAVLRLVEARGAPSVAINLRQWASAIFRLAARTSRCVADPAGLLKGVILRPPVQNAQALGREGAGVLLTRIRGYGGNLTTKVAALLMAYTFVRTIEARNAEWSEFDLEAGLWEIPAAKMKKRRIHLVPLSSQAVAAVRELLPLTSGGRYLFPNSRKVDTVMSATTINRALEHMGYASAEVTGHDFRATASTMLYEKGYREEVVEMQLAHVEAKKTKRAYNHAKYLDERRAMMQWFADELDASAAEQAALALARRSVAVE
jgi:integrase